MLWWALMFLCSFELYDVCWSQDLVEQSSIVMTSSEGDGVVLKCIYTTTSTTPGLFWYKKLPNTSPKLILSQYTTEADYLNRFSAKLEKASKSFPLMIQKVQVSDSAVYHCALKPTVTGCTGAQNKNMTQGCSMFGGILICLCFISKYDVCWGQDRVEQSSGELSAREGDTVTISCNYITTDTNPYLFWYKKLQNTSPTFILSEFTFGKGTTELEFRERFSATLNATSKRVPLLIKNVLVSDSAVYYCALRPTVTGSMRALHKNME
ncbi:hypothetical protein DNTS_029937 [Danionella cerebrum]|uniref:Ig-like domain-containing protein n=1 Tax=Danionella cerebrum TaxID=2873325 RepID=A0A553RPZ1_9TELE|nr:hypothetical protein DNTS_029937 [Danionella translucida]